MKIHAHGYILIASPDHPFKDKQGYVRQHRLVMEQSVGRYLRPEEDVHHIDHDKQNNDVSNLELFSNRSAHLKARHRDGGKKGWFKKGQIPHNKYLESKDCLNCDVSFQPSSKDKIYCSHECYSKAKVKTECSKGHPMSGENIIKVKNTNTQVCRVCKNERVRLWRLNKKGLLV